MLQGGHIERSLRMGQHSQRVTVSSFIILLEYSYPCQGHANLLELTRDITCARTHILALTLHRTDSLNPWTHFDFVEVEVLPMTLLDAIYSNRGDLDVNPVPSLFALTPETQETPNDARLVITGFLR